MASRLGSLRARGEPGRLVFSVDVELAWGCFYRVDSQRIGTRLEGARQALAWMLQAFASRKIGATWAFVGHLFLERCSGRHGSVPVHQSWYEADWYASDPGTSLEDDPEWYGTDLVRAVKESPVEHELAAHGFSHCFLDDPAVTDAALAQELRLTVEAAAAAGVEVSSFVFPRNRVSRPGLLKKAGFEAYRSPGSEMGRGRSRTLAVRAGHILQQALGIAPAPDRATVDESGMVAVPGTNLYLSTASWRKAIPVACRVRRARSGMERAALGRGIFHLWCHLEDFLESGRSYARGFERILDHAARLREAGAVRILTMKQVAKEMKPGEDSGHQ